ncbi:GH3 auxin-responsive promoter family protein [Cryomorpha ignava]|uniref:GH3 auxin-responsive promoter family protein n=1 Tax=Cryomorpha ignava TaxID=101383 RepID=A0A7K3WN64_9FLAO|nr:GH3 auxin-responsive promoter family protein [Cryomorpha ignava]NEN22934.1 GH3 auxin-responsive promoter family protein [Cryomorpha ignava]
MALHSVFSWFMKKRLHQIELFMKYPIEVQNEVFEKLIGMGKITEFGKDHNFSQMMAQTHFREQVPLQTYEDVKPYVKRLQQGEQNLLWSTPINWFAKSSGTTSDKSKFIPVSREALEDCHYKAGKDLLALYNHNHPNNKVYNGKSLVLGGSSQVNEFRTDSYYGDLSAIIINNLPFWVEMKRIPDREIALMDKWEPKIEKMAQSVKDENVTNIAGVPSWTLVLMKRILELTGKKNIREVWPNLELYMHGGVSFEPYQKQFEKLIPDNRIQYYESYNASEGYFGIQDRAGAHDMLLMLDYGIFYEFIPIENVHDTNPQTISLKEVEVGKNYEMVISTNGGLWRYRLGDTVIFTSVFPFRIKVSGRTKHFINAFGEELIIDNADQAIMRANEICHCTILDFTAAPVYMSDTAQGAHEWLIEFSQAPDNLEHFTKVLDAELKKVNSDYEAKRTGDLSLKMPIVKAVPEGTFYNWLKKRDKLGGQHKVPRLSNDRKLVDEILSDMAD